MPGIFKTVLAKAGSKIVEVRESRTKRLNELHGERIRENVDLDKQRLDEWRSREESLRERHERNRFEDDQRRLDDEERIRREDEARRRS